MSVEVRNLRDLPEKSTIEDGDIMYIQGSSSNKVPVSKLKQKMVGDFEAQLAQIATEKVTKNEVGTITNVMLSQEVKEAMTGGSVAVVGVNAVLEENIVNGAVTPDKTTFLKKYVNLFDSSNVVIGSRPMAGTGLTYNDFETGGSYMTSPIIDISLYKGKTLVINLPKAEVNRTVLYNSSGVYLSSILNYIVDHGTYSTLTLTVAGLAGNQTLYDTMKYMRMSLLYTNFYSTTSGFIKTIMIIEESQYDGTIVPYGTTVNTNQLADINLLKSEVAVTKSNAIQKINTLTNTTKFALIDDDANPRFMTLIKPILDSYGFKCTLGLITDSINMSDTNDSTVNPTTIASMLSSGYEIVSHSKTHSESVWKYINNPTRDTVYNECMESREFVESLNGNTDIFVYPFGDTAYGGSNPTFYRRIAKEAGYRYGINAVGGLLGDKDVLDTMMIGRLFIDISANNLAYYTTRIDWAIDRGLCLLFGTHSGDTTQLPDGTLLDGIMSYINSKGYSVGTVSNLIKEIDNICSIGIYGDRGNSLYIGKTGKLYNP